MFAPSRNENTIPSMVTTDSAALRKAYTPTTFQRDNPLARAVRTKSLDSAVSIEARVMRASGASENSASDSAGNSNCDNDARNSVRFPASKLSMRKIRSRAGGGE